MLLNLWWNIVVGRHVTGLALVHDVEFLAAKALVRETLGLNEGIPVGALLSQVVGLVGLGLDVKTAELATQVTLGWHLAVLLGTLVEHWTVATMACAWSRRKLDVAVVFVVYGDCHHSVAGGLAHVVCEGLLLLTWAGKAA